MIAVAGGGGGSGNRVIDAITSVAQSLGLPPAIPLSIAGWETRGAYNADSYNASDWNGYASVGPFQLNTAPGNPGYGYTNAQLMDPVTNASIAEHLMLAPYQRGVSQGLTGTALLDYVANNAGWPDSAGVAVANSAEPAYDVGLNNFYNAGNFGSYSASGGLPAPFGASPAITSGTASFLQGFDQKMQFQGFDILHPVSYISNNGEAIALRALLFIVGILLVVFGLYAAVQKGMS